MRPEHLHSVVREGKRKENYIKSAKMYVQRIRHTRLIDHSHDLHAKIIAAQKMYCHYQSDVIGRQSMEFN